MLGEDQERRARKFMTFDAGYAGHPDDLLASDVEYLASNHLWGMA